MTSCILNRVTDRNVDQHEHSGPCEIKTKCNELTNLHGKDWF